MGDPLDFSRLTLLPCHNFGQAKLEKICPIEENLDVGAPSEILLHDIREFIAARIIVVKSA